MINQMVLSRDIEWVGYEKSRRMLQVELIVGGIYQYQDVPEEIYESFLVADSYSRFLEIELKGKYSCRKVRA